jgi:hypothetical protein
MIKGESLTNQNHLKSWKKFISDVFGYKGMETIFIPQSKVSYDSVLLFGFV